MAKKKKVSLSLRKRSRSRKIIGHLIGNHHGLSVKVVEGVLQDFDKLERDYICLQPRKRK